MSLFGITYKVLADVVEVLAVLLQRLLEQHGLRCAPLLHLVPAQHRPTLWHQRGHGLSQVIAVLLQGVHGMKLYRGRGERERRGRLLCKSPESTVQGYNRKNHFGTVRACIIVGVIQFVLVLLRVPYSLWLYYCGSVIQFVVVLRLVMDHDVHVKDSSLMQEH